METPKNHGKRWSQQDINSMKSSFDKGVSIKNLAIKYGRTETSIRTYLNRLEIMEEIKKRNITELLHFTDKRNIRTIKRYGLLGINNLKNKNIKFLPNDDKRLDSTENSGFICMSISYLNRPLLKAFNARLKRNWIRISIDPSILLKYNCQFFDCNASTKKFRNTEKYNPEYLRSAKAFKSMFDGIVEERSGFIAKRSSGPEDLKDWFKAPNATTSIQAEIQIDHIPLKYIIAYEEINDV